MHENCALIKVNGDYRNIRTLNTPEELSDKYPVPIAKLIRQVFEEYGLIISGWSAEYDVRLRRILSAIAIENFLFIGQPDMIRASRQVS